MRAIGFLLLLLLGACRTQATLTLVNRETFQGVGALNAGTPGALGTVTAGNFYKRAGGPRLSSDTSAGSGGWSADPHLAAGSQLAWHQWSVSGELVTGGVLSCWYFIPELVPSGPNAGELNEVKQANGNPLVRVKYFPNINKNFWTFRSNDWQDRDSGIAVPLRQWFELRHSWHRNSGNNFEYCLAFRLAGSSTWTILTNLTGYTMAGPPELTLSGFGSVAAQRLRYGMPSLYSSSDYANDKIAAIADVLDPVRPMTWYVDAATGNDANDGATAATAWQTPAKVDTESQYCGLFAADSNTAGDTLIVDTSAAVWDLQGGILNLRTDGLTVKATPSQDYIRCKLYKSLANASFTKVGGLNHTYSIVDASQSCVLWEDDKWLNHPMGASWASVSAAVDSTPGSFWTDGTTLFVHPFGDTDPTIDAKRYERSYYGSTIQQWGSNTRTMDIHAGKTCLAKKEDNDSLGGYCLGTAGAVNGTTVIQHCYFYYGSKHGLGLVADGVNSTTIISDCQNEQCSPYDSQSPWVSFMTYGTSTNNVHIYTNCTTRMMAGLIGSTNGQHLGIPVLLSHTDTPGAVNFRTIYLRNCHFPSGHINLGVSTNCIVQGGTYGNFQNYNYFLNIEAANILSVQNLAGNDVVVKSCLIAPDVAYGNGSGFGAISTMRIEGCTFDTRNIPSTDAAYRSMIMRLGAASLIFRDNVFICKSGGQFTLFGNFTSSDTLMISNNVYLLGSGNAIAWQYNDGSTTADRTLSAWQGYGFDANTVTHGLQFSGNGRPYSRFYFNQGVPIGAAMEYGEKAFANRQTVGTYEWQTPNPRLLLFHR